MVGGVEWDAAKAQWESLSATQSEAQRALAYRLLRLAETYLLQLLTTRGVLPARGFPVDARTDHRQAEDCAGRRPPIARQ